MRLTLKILKEEIDRVDGALDKRLENKLFSLNNRVSLLEGMLRGGSRGYEGLIFRVSLLERLIEIKKHVKPVTKKQMAEIRRLIKVNFKEEER